MLIYRKIIKSNIEVKLCSANEPLKFEMPQIRKSDEHYQISWGKYYYQQKKIYQGRIPWWKISTINFNDFFVDKFFLADGGVVVFPDETDQYKIKLFDKFKNCKRSKNHHFFIKDEFLFCDNEKIILKKPIFYRHNVFTLEECRYYQNFGDNEPFIWMFSNDEELYGFN